MDPYGCLQLTICVPERLSFKPKLIIERFTISNLFQKYGEQRRYPLSILLTLI